MGHWEENEGLTENHLLLDLTKDTILDNLIPGKFYSD